LYFSGKNKSKYFKYLDVQIKTCVNNAIYRINNGTCINLRENSSETINSMIKYNKTLLYLQQSERGLCGIDADNFNIIYLSRECILNVKTKKKLYFLRKKLIFFF
jgi:hypothetical protein